MTQYYPYHLSPYGRTFTPEFPNAYDSGKATRAYFLSKSEAVAWLRKDFLGCSIQKQYGAAFVAEINDNEGPCTIPVKVKRIKFVKKAKPATRWRPTWIATRENPIYEAGRVDDNSWKSFETKKEALEYADRYCSRPYWRPGTPKEVK